MISGRGGMDSKVSGPVSNPGPSSYHSYMLVDAGRRSRRYSIPPFRYRRWTNLTHCDVLAARHALQASRSQQRDERFRMA
jgi:hypothetical protein